MIRFDYSGLYAVFAAVMILFMSYIGKENDKKTRHLANQLKLVLLMNVVFFLTFVIRYFEYYIFSHCLILILEVWILYYLLEFSCIYAGAKKYDLKNARIILFIICSLDSVMLLVNSCTQKFFGFDKVILQDGDMYMRPVINCWYLVHLIFCTLLDVALVLVMIKRACEISVFYMKRYVTAGVSFAIGFCVCFVLRTVGKHYNYPVVVFLSLGEILIFTLFYYLPKWRTNMMKGFIIENVTVPLLMFDCDDELQVINQPGQELTEVFLGMKLDEYVQKSDLKYILTKERRKAGKTKEFTLTQMNNKGAYLVHGQELWNGKNFIGTLLAYDDMSNQEMLKDEVTFHATRDSLTGLWNREYFSERAKEIIKENPNKEFLLLMSDIHQFKMFNDILGKKMGDDLLITMANGFMTKKKTDWILSRYAGDRFAMLIPAEDYEETEFLEFCKGIIEERDYALTVHFAFGIYNIVDRTLSVEEMCDRATMAVETIRDNHKQVIAYYDEEIRKKHLHAAMSVSELGKALKEGEFQLYLQPQIDTFANKLIGGEALVRWFSPKKGMIPPSEFIQAFEDNGMIADLDCYVWELACKQLKKWENEGYGDRTISVNISAKDFYLADVYKSITSLVNKYNLNPKHLKLEITETAFVLNVKEQMNLVERLQAAGFIVEIDDFGSGYSSLNSLKDIRADVLKLDMKFFEKCSEPERAEKIIESSVDLAHNLKMPVIAEGVEEAEQVEMLKRIGCRIIQGYFYSKPLPIPEYEEFCKKYENEDIQDIIDELNKC